MDFSHERLKKLHESLIEILDYIDEICKKNKLVYFLIGGTTLGAYRHGGFIPWDDDLDIALLRKDYEQLIQLIRNDGNEHYIVQNEDDEEKYFLPFAKVRKVGTVFKEKVSPDVYKNEGIFIDIFPIDSLDEVTSVKSKLRIKTIKFISHILRFRTCRSFFRKSNSSLKFWINTILCIPFYCISNNQLLKFQKKLMMARDEFPAKFLVSYGSTYPFKKEILPVEWCFPLSTISFEGKEMLCYRNIDSYLTQLYGDYMKLPPVEKRHSHEPLELKF